MSSTSAPLRWRLRREWQGRGREIKDMSIAITLYVMLFAIFKHIEQVYMHFFLTTRAFQLLL